MTVPPAGNNPRPERSPRGGCLSCPLCLHSPGLYLSPALPSAPLWLPMALKQPGRSRWPSLWPLWVPDEGNGSAGPRRAVCSLGGRGSCSGPQSPHRTRPWMAMQRRLSAVSGVQIEGLEGT